MDILVVIITILVNLSIVAIFSAIGGLIGYLLKRKKKDELEAYELNRE